jgi:hypothetical protein
VKGKCSEREAEAYGLEDGAGWSERRGSSRVGGRASIVRRRYLSFFAAGFSGSTVTAVAVIGGVAG